MLAKTTIIHKMSKNKIISSESDLDHEENMIEMKDIIKDQKEEEQKEREFDEVLRDIESTGNNKKKKKKRKNKKAEDEIEENKEKIPEKKFEEKGTETVEKAIETQDLEKKENIDIENNKNSDKKKKAKKAKGFFLYEVLSQKKKDKKQKKKDNIQPARITQIQISNTCQSTSKKQEEKVDISSQKNSVSILKTKYFKKEPYVMLTETKESLIELKGENKTPNKVFNSDYLMEYDSLEGSKTSSFSKNLESTSPGISTSQSNLEIEQNEFKKNQKKNMNRVNKVIYKNNTNNIIPQQPIINNFFIIKNNYKKKYNNHGNITQNLNFNNFQMKMSNFFDSLSSEIMNYEKNLNKIMEILLPYKEKCINKIRKLLNRIINNNYEFDLKLYGSYVTKLSIETSDIDILIRFRKLKKDNPGSTTSVSDIISLLQKGFIILKGNHFILTIDAIYTASVPVLKLEVDLKKLIPEEVGEKIKSQYIFNIEEIYKLNFDFTFLEIKEENQIINNTINDKNDINIPSLEIIKFINKNLSIYPEIRPILLILKRYMHINKLNSTYKGGISSYSLFLLVLSYFQYLNENKHLYNFNNIGKKLYHFFDFFCHFNFESFIVDVSKIPCFILNNSNENNITIIDPITSLNVSKSSYQLDEIKNTFGKGMILLYNKMICGKNDSFTNEKAEKKTMDILWDLFMNMNFIFNNNINFFNYNMESN